MPKLSSALIPSEPDPAILTKLTLVERASLALLTLVVAINVAGWLVPSIEHKLPGGWPTMRAESVLAVLLSALSVLLSDVGQSRRMHRLGMLLAAVVALLAGIVLVAHRFDTLANFEMRLPFAHLSLAPGWMSLESAIGFGLLSCSMILIRAQGRFAVRIADLLMFGVCLTMMTIVSGQFVGSMSLFGIPAVVPTSPDTLFCMILLTIVMLIRRMDNGILSIFTGRGLGGRLARRLSLILLALPFLREGARARILGTGQMPAHYLTAMLASLAAIVSIALLLYLAWRINGMESEIHVLTLRDELTGLYNLRGFHLLADQALRLAQRSNLPFSVMYIDLDNLKQTNDLLGHQTGSAFLVETSEILRNTFRETDVLGRIGGDEFAVAGHFSNASVLMATQRLEASCAERNSEGGRRFTLSFSVGHVTSDSAGRETLDELLANADQAMYSVKRSKKKRKLQTEIGIPPGGHGPRIQ